jgi:hypothetical protein
MRSPRSQLVAAVLIAALTAGRAGAGLVPWSYQWNAHPIVVNADSSSPNSPPPGGITLIPGAITITGGSHGAALGSASIVAVNLSTFTFSPSPSGVPDRFSNASYTLSVTLSDLDSGKSGSLKFNGIFNGTMTDSSISLQTRFTSPTKQSVTIGHNAYTVTMTSYTPPGPPSVGNEGEIKAFVDVRPDTAPEPSTLLLCGIGFVTALFSPFCRPRWRSP